MKREIRIEDVVKILTCVIALTGFLSIVRYIGASYSIVFSSLYLFALYFEYHGRFLLPRWLLTIAAFLIIFATFFRISTDDPVVASVEALLILLAIKMLGDKKFRDYMQIYAMALFLLTGSSLLSLDMEFLIYFISFIFLVTIALVFLTYLSQDDRIELKFPALIKIVSKCSLIPLIAVPSTIFLFIVLPRSSYPLLTFLNRGTIANTGFADTVALGKVSAIQEDSSVILRAHMAKIDEGSLYWRGIVLDHFDGSSWQTSRGEKTANDGATRLTGRQVVQTIYLEPYGNKYLFALDRPVSISLKRSVQYGDVTYSVAGNIVKRTRYEATSVLSDNQPGGRADSAAYLQLPERKLERVRKLARTFSAGRTREETVQAMLNFLRSGGFQYTMENMTVSDDPLDDFLFGSKKGNCEYFASALAAMLRSVDIPSRLVGGYKGGYYNDSGEYYLVPQKNAHVWVEAYLNKGWVRLDPTPAGMENFVSAAKRGLFFRLRLLFDSMSYYWNAAVINYDFSRQLQLFNKIRSFRIPRLRLSMKREDLTTYLPIAIIIAGVGAGILFFVRRRKAPEELILNAFFRELKKKGYEKKRSEGLEEFAAKISQVLLRERALAFAREFQRHYYKDRSFTKDDVRRLKEMIKQKTKSKK